MEKEADLGKNEGKRRFSRRELFAGTAGLALAGAAYEFFPKGETETATGIFYPIYESHAVGITPAQIPSGIDIFFREFSIQYSPQSGDLYSNTPENILTFRLPNSEFGASTHAEKDFPVFKPENLSLLAQRGVKVMVGDLYVNEDLQDQESNENLLGLIALGSTGALVYPTTKAIIDDAIGTNRRKFLTALSTVAAAWIAPRAIIEILTDSIDHYTGPVANFMVQLDGLTTDIHPESQEIFFRNLNMANKMLTAADKFKKQTGRKAKIAFEVGNFHAGIETFLQLGRDTCRNLILAFPKSYLQSVADQNGGIDSLGESRLFTLPNSLTQADVQLGILGNIQEHDIFDDPLLEGLKSKLT